MGVIAAGRVDTSMNPAVIGTKSLGRLEFDRKVDLYFLGLDALLKLGFKNWIGHRYWLMMNI